MGSEMKLKAYKNQKCEIDLCILEKEIDCFSVLARILRGKCALTLTDGARIVICHSSHPYPIWIWNEEDVTEEEKACIYATLREHFGFFGDHTFNVKRTMAEYLIGRARQDGFTLRIKTDICAYRCETPVEPLRAVDGKMCVACAADEAEVTALLLAFQEETGIDPLPVEVLRAQGREMIAEQYFFLWRKENGEAVASCRIGTLPNGMHVGKVYTKRDARRKGYAANLVHAVTKRILSMGKRAILYTDASNPASNACYTSIGYELCGDLCTVESI